MQDAEDTGTPIVASPLPLAVTVNAVIPLETFTLRYVLAVLRAHKGKKSATARALAVTRYKLAVHLKRAAELGMV